MNSLLDSLSKQSYKNFEVIIIDQNLSGYLDDLIRTWLSRLNIIHRNVSFKGLSRARNFGIKISNSNIIAFPDDDSHYDPNTLEKVFNHFNNNIETEILLCQMIDNSKNILSRMKKSNYSYKINSIYDLFMAKATSNQIFLKSNILKRVNQDIFDEDMGVGSGTLYGSSEETDLLLRLFRKHSKILVHNNIFVFHPTIHPNPSKSYLYGLGRYRLIRKNKLGFIFHLINIIYPVIKIFIRLDLNKYKSYLATIIGRSGFEFLYPIYFNEKE